MKTSLFLFVAYVLLTGCTNFGEKVEIGKSEVFYSKEDVTKKQAQALGDYLVEKGFLDEEKKGSVQLVKQNDVYLVKMVMANGKAPALPTRLLMWKEEYNLSKEVFDGEDARFVFTDNQFKTLDALEPVARVTIGKSSVYYDDGEFDKKEAQKLANLLHEKEYLGKDKSVDVFLTAEDNIPIVRLVVNKAMVDEQQEKVIPVFSYWQSLIQEKVLNTKKAKMVLATVQMKDFKTVPKYNDEMRAIVEGPTTTETTDHTSTIDSMATQTTVSGIERIRD